ncbi:hypothetical protein C8F04DRAFT_1398149 [Mycena alexandri]|uniref:MI domain-containing protein n=1 Tax=Mycena alexandri TaxID=1745969 RepID=A0AAD6SM78_9AGAR|nr:hypothetical protein C8F04DRAFT_1398149 [Mycena alexandri]
MSKSSTATLPKIPTQLPTKSAWAKGPPQTASAPSPTRSQSPALPNAPHLTHSRRPSALGQGVPIKDGVSIPRNNVGAVKQGSAVTFGSIDDVSAPISSSPAAAPAIKSDTTVKSFGSVPATMGHVNGKASISKPIASSTSSAAASTSSTPPPSTPATPVKPLKMDVRMFFQTASTPAPPSQPENSSPSPRPSNLPQQQPQQQQQNQSQPPSQPSQLGAHGYTPFVPQGGMRPPSQQNSGTSGSGGPRSPVYPRQQMANGNGPRPPNGPNGPGGPSQMSTGLSSPRLSQHPHPGQQGMPPPQMPPQMQPQMQQQMWPGHFYYPGLPPEQAQYMPYQAGWYGMPAPQQQHPGMPPQHQHQPMQHHVPPPVQQQHSGIPMSPRNHPVPLHSGPGTPTPAHAVAAPHHVPPPLSQHHSSSSNVSVSSPPPTPSSARLNTNASAFVPGGTPRAKKIVLKSADGTEVKLETLKQQTQSPTPTAPSTTNAVTSPPASTPVAGGSPGHNNRKSVQIRMESEEARKKRIAEEEEKEKEKAKVKAEAEEKERKEKEEKEKERLRKEEEEKEKVRLEEERKRKEEEEKERVRLEEVRKKEEAEAKAKAEAEEKERKEREEKERLQKEEEEEKERVRKAEEEARLKKEEEEAAAAAAATSTITEEPTSTSEEEGEVQEVSVKPKEETDEDVATPVKEKPQAPLRIDTASSAPLEFPRKRPGRLDLTNTHTTNIPAALPSALATARIIDDLSRVPYPENIQSPKVELNINAKDGKFRYDRDFLLQFMSICKEKPDMLPPLDAIGIGPVDQNSMSRTTSRGGTHRPGRTPSISNAPGANNSPGFPGFNAKAAPFGMGNFGTGTGAKLSSEERYNNSLRAASGSAIPPFGRPAPMTRTSSQPGVSSGLSGSKRTRSRRGETRDKNNSTQPSHNGSGFGGNNSSMAPGFDNPSPLQVTANRWDRKTVGAVDPDSPEIVDRKVKGLLNKLTMEKFDSISDQIIEWANKSEKEKDGRTLIQVIRLVFEKATDEATWSEMYARLCRKMMEQISPKVQDDGIKNTEGKPIAGGQLFRKYLLNRCQEDFERGWVAKEATAAAAATKAMEDKAAKAANEKSTEAGASGEPNDEIVLYSDEYYAAQKAKRQGLGLIKFIGELFKLQMLTERIMHECVKKLLGNVENPEEEEIESLCKLISTVGLLLDTPKARAHMDVYFSRMKELCKSNNVSSRMQFMLQDVIELRDRKWINRTLVAAPSTIAAVHEAAAKEKAVAEKESYNRTISMSRGGSRRGADRGEFQGPGPDGWNVAGGNTPRPPPKAGDLSNFGKIGSNSKGLPMTFGPSSVFSGKKDNKRESLSRASSSSNMFSMLSQTGEPSADAAKAAAPEPAQRRRLILQPRSKPAADEQGSATAEATPAGSADNSEEEEEEAPLMSVEDADKKIAEDSKEFFAVRNLDEAEVYFTALPAAHHPRLIEKLVGQAVESKEINAQLVADLIARAVSKELCTIDALEEGFSPLVEILEDLAIDAPKAPNSMALMMKSASFDSERTARIAAKSGEPDTLLALLS